MIRGQRVQLRLPDTEEDHVLQVQWRNQPEISAYFYSDEPVSYEGHMQWWAKLRQDVTQRFYIIDALTEPVEPYNQLVQPIPIGTTSLLHIDLINRTAEYGRLMIGDDNYRGKGGGFALEAEVLLMKHGFYSLNLNRICGYVLEFNKRVMRLHDKVGFKEEGLLRQNIYKNGRYYDVIVIGLLAEEFRQLYPPDEVL
jgi:UDP-4-amino-4,6-dideoxy-N-acetyl-beta-L-altrosamine N-acetyltransferase